MDRVRSSCVWTLIAAILLQSVSPSLARAEWPKWNWLKNHHKYQGNPPKTRSDEAVEELARNIDWLEGELDKWGTVVAKAPDVWGEARLTQFRHEVEQELAKNVSKFEKNQINAAEYIADQAYLAVALAMQFGASGGTNVPQPTVSVGINSDQTPTGGTSTASAGQNGANANINIRTEANSNLFGIEQSKLTIGSGLVLEQVQQLDQLKRYMDHLNELRRINEGDDNSDAPGYSLNLIRIPVSVLPGANSRVGCGAEITITAEPMYSEELLPTAYRDFVINDLVDQLALPLARFLNDDPQFAKNILHTYSTYLRAQRELNELRAELVKQGESCVPVSKPLNPVAKELRRILNETANQLIHPESLCFNDGFIKHATNDELASEAAKLDKFRGKSLPTPKEAFAFRKALTAIEPTGAHASVEGSLSPPVDGSRAVPIESLQPAAQEAIRGILRYYTPGSRPPTTGNEEASQRRDTEELQEGRNRFNLIESPEAPLPELTWGGVLSINQSLSQLDKVESLLASVNKLRVTLQANQEQDRQMETALRSLSVPTSSTRRSILPYPPSQLQTVLGLSEIGQIAVAAGDAYRNDIINRQVVHITDLQGFLREELSAGYELLAIEPMRHVWEIESTGERQLYNAIRLGDEQEIRRLREGFFQDIGPHAKTSMSAIMAWAVFVESVLLNERLIEDIRKTVPAGTCIVSSGGWLPFFGPNPPVEAREVFATYTRIRWPLRIFTIDPVVTEQNVASMTTTLRQMQMSIALAVAGGTMSTSAAMRSLRQIKRDMATIDLNRTVVGFMHGEDTFGWRFYPRFQTAPVEGNLTVFFRDLIAGGPTDEQLLRSRQIEPGVRECVALVLMPSFVDRVVFDTRGNWFKLTHPGATGTSIQETVHFSRGIQAMRMNAQQCVHHDHLYRPGEVSRLLRRVDQLDRKLPLQTLDCQVPIANTLGGFEIFSSGTRELAPELLGWYGAPGYDVVNGASFYLAGDNFHVHQNSIIAGNCTVAIQKMLSRQVIQVTLPPGLSVIKDERLHGATPGDYDGYIDVHMASPYGVSGHLLIPVVKPPSMPDVAVRWQPGFLRMKGKIKETVDGNNKRYEIENLTFLKGSPLRAQLPRLGNVPNEIKLNMKLLRQTPTGLEELKSESPASPSGRYLADVSMVEFKVDNLGSLHALVAQHLVKLLNERGGSPGIDSLVVTGSLNIGTLTEIPMEGGIHLEIQLDR